MCCHWKIIAIHRANASHRLLFHAAFSSERGSLFDDRRQTEVASHFLKDYHHAENASTMAHVLDRRYWSERP